MVHNYPMVAIASGAAAGCLIATLVGRMFARAGFPLPSPDRRIGCVDGLRGYLALSVLIHHFICWIQVTRLGGQWSDLGVNVFTSLGKGGVALFFMTTGFVFYPRILAGFRRTSWFATYVGRFFRIFPLILISIATITMIIARRTGNIPDDAYPFAIMQWITGWEEPPLLGYNNSVLLNAGVLWSIWFEWLFYIFLLPASALGMDLIRGRLPTWSLPLALLLIAPILRFVHLQQLGGVDLYLPLFASGMLVYECQRHELIQSFFKSRSLSILAIACLVIGMNYAPHPYYGIQFIPYALFFTAVACGNSFFGLLNTTGALFLGEISYGIYLIHGIILNIIFVGFEPVIARVSTAHMPVMLLPLAILIVVCITPVTYLLIERPAIRAGRQIASRASGRQVTAKTIRLEIAP